jgi:hypothetical protein
MIWIEKISQDLGRSVQRLEMWLSGAANRAGSNIVSSLLRAELARQD